jgi:ABC-type glutathione transport system ATPase component
MLANTYIHTQLQGGQRRRLCVGMSMVARNAVVILDEPTGKSALHSLSAPLL